MATWEVPQASNDGIGALGRMWVGLDLGRGVSSDPKTP